jgi:hypothetical protein
MSIDTLCHFPTLALAYQAMVGKTDHIDEGGLAMRLRAALLVVIWVPLCAIALEGREKSAEVDTPKYRQMFIMGV